MNLKILQNLDNLKTVSSMPTTALALYLCNKNESSNIVIVPNMKIAQELLLLTQSFSSTPHKVLIFPDWDSLPEYQNSPSTRIQTERLKVLFTLTNNAKGFTIIVPWKAILQKLPPQEYIIDYSDVISPNTNIEVEKLSLDLVSCGYERMDLVEAPGTFSIRGNIIDIYSPSEQNPIRIELLGDLVETIKEFHPVTQRTISIKEAFYISPVKEISFAAHNVELFKANFKEYLDNNKIRKDIREEYIEFVDNKTCFPGLEYYLPFFYKNLSVFWNYISPESNLIFFDEHLFEGTEIKKTTNNKDVLPFPEELLFINKDSAFNSISNFDPKIFYSVEFETNNAFSLNNQFIEQETRIKDMKEYHKELLYKGYTIRYVCTNLTQAQRLFSILHSCDNKINIENQKTFKDFILNQNTDSCIYISNFNKTLLMPEQRLAIISEKQIFGEKKRSINTVTKAQDVFLNVFKELKEGDYVVHSNHGLGIYKGLKKLKIDNIENDFFKIEYADGDTLFVPVYRLNTVQKYIGQSSEVKLDKMGGSTWSKKRNKAQKSAMELAEKLVKIQAERKSKKGFSFSPSDELFMQFESSFEYEETPDQLKTINDVIEDMEKPFPMDRLVCGDVGFGKTEVALRASFKAVRDKKQVAIIAPTTILAFQHYQVFTERFKNHAVNIEMMTRFRNKKEQKQMVEKIEKGELDIIIGTHRLLSSDINFLDLGLLIIDEEQRFGVKQKEKIKELSPNIDILSMTATPIPRTLNMAFTGLKDISIISTAPTNRMPIKTFVAKFSSELIKRAILHEKERGGQVFFVHNRVQDLPELYKKISNIVPEAKIIMAHGQMEDKVLEEKMLEFYKKEADVLLCTSIIESGLDVPNANTIIINRADMFGLSQLYQIRGRVGRSPKPAYCYLLLPSSFTVGKSAMERIKILQKFTELGAGFNIASHDLEFRGAGELLGSSQSGFIDDIGLDEYLKLINDAVHTIKGEEPEDDFDTEISINAPAFIPENYIQSITQRLYFYKKIANTKNRIELLDIEEELNDRFGPVPREIKTLFSLVTMKHYLRPLRINSVKIGSGKLVYTFDKNTKILPDTIVNLVSRLPNKYKLTPEMKLISNIDDKDGISVIREIEYFISIVGGDTV